MWIVGREVTGKFVTVLLSVDVTRIGQTTIMYPCACVSVVVVFGFTRTSDLVWVGDTVTSNPFRHETNYRREAEFGNPQERHVCALHAQTLVFVFLGSKYRPALYLTA